MDASDSNTAARTSSDKTGQQKGERMTVKS